MSCSYLIRSGTVRFELTTFLRSTYFQDKRHKPDSTKCPLEKIYKYIYIIKNKTEGN